MAISNLLKTPTTLYQTPATGAVVLMTVVAAASVQPLTDPPPRQNQKKPSSCFNNRHPSSLGTAVTDILSIMDMSPAESALNFTKALTVKVGVFRPGRLPTSMVGPVPSN